MREIKFRAWDRMRHKWVIEGEMQGMFGFRSLRSPHYYWQQYTGLKDRVGKEIYEGDLVKSDVSAPVEVFWDQNTTGWQPFLFHSKKDGWKIVGNIYQNPNLVLRS